MINETTHCHPTNTIIMLFQLKPANQYHYYVVLTQTILLESYFSEATRQQQPTQICCSAGYQMQAPRLKWEQETAGSWWGGHYPWPGHRTLAEEVQMHALLGWLKHQSPRCGTSSSSPLRNHCVRYLRNRWLHLSLVILESSNQVWILKSRLHKTFELSLINNYEDSPVTASSTSSPPGCSSMKGVTSYTWNVTQHELDIVKAYFAAHITGISSGKFLNSCWVHFLTPTESNPLGAEKTLDRMAIHGTLEHSRPHNWNGYQQTYRPHILQRHHFGGATQHQPRPCELTALIHLNWLISFHHD